MAENSSISWCDHTFNPWWGCTKVSPGCDNCYAESLARRYGRDVWGRGKPRMRTSAAYWKQPLKWNREAEAAGVRRRVFCASMADVFDAEVPSAWRERLWELICETPWLDWLLLTKRPNRIARNIPWGPGDEPWHNVWLGTSVESQAQEWRVAKLLEVDAVVRFLSCEPLLGLVNIDIYVMGYGGIDEEEGEILYPLRDPGIHWVIAGCESAPGKRPGRPCETDWLRSLRDQCTAAGVPFFLKQRVIGARVVELPELDGQSWAQVPTPLITHNSSLITAAKP